MKISLKFKTIKNELPIEYRKLIMSFIKNSMQNVSGSLYTKYYGNCKQKNFTFSTYIKGIKYEVDRIIMEDNNFNVTLSTNDNDLGFLLINMFNNMKMKAFPVVNDNYMILLDVKQLKEQKVLSNTILCKTLSPICFLEHDRENNKNNKYYSIKSDKFIEKIKEKYNVDFINIDSKMTIVKHQNMKFETTSGYFMLKGNIETLEKLYKNGLGNHTGQGFGMFKILN